MIERIIQISEETNELNREFRRNVHDQWTHEKEVNTLSLEGNAIEATWRFPLVAVKMLSSMKTKMTTNVEEEAGRGNLQCWWDFKMVQPLAKSDLPFLSFYSRTWKSAHRKVPFPAMLWWHYVQQTKHAISPEIHQQRSETSVLDPMQFYSATKRRELWCLIELEMMFKKIS